MQNPDRDGTFHDDVDYARRKGNSTSLTSSTTNVAPVGSNSCANTADNWLSSIPLALQQRQLTCREETIISAQALVDAGQLGSLTTTSSQQSSLSPQVEASLLESFLEDDYNGSLHLNTLIEINDKSGDSSVVGFVFWREVPSEEMHEWIHWEAWSRRLRRELAVQQIKPEGDEYETEEQLKLTNRLLPSKSTSVTRTGRRSLRCSAQQLVREQSIRWLEIAAAAEAGASNNNTPTLASTSSDTAGGGALIQTRSPSWQEQLVHAWVKLELLGVHPDHWGQGLGTLLLACAMLQAHHLYHKQHMILHVAGGSDNVPAVRLYDKFGFCHVPTSSQLFHKPNRDLFVLGHIGQSLQRLDWPELLQRGDDTTVKSKRLTEDPDS